MKTLNYLFTVFCVIAFISCSNGSDKQQNTNISDLDNYNDAFKKASKTEIHVDTVFLGLRFGMTKKEVSSHMQEMRRTGKIKVNTLDQYEYLFKTNNGDIGARIGADFYEDKLYEVSLDLSTYYINGIPSHSMDLDVMIDQVRSIFLSKYIVNKGIFDKYHYNIGIGDTHCYVNKNLVVEFSPLGRVTYTNAPISAKMMSLKRKVLE